MRELYLDDRGLKMTRLTDPTAGTGTGAAAAGPADMATAPYDTTGTDGERGGGVGSPAVPFLSAEQIRKSLEGRLVCPFCGAVDEAAGGPCPRCTLENTPATRKATKERIGPWYVLQTRNPAAPGMRFETLLSFVRKGRVKPRSIVRGPTTHQLWRFAAQVKGLSREFGVCYSCGNALDPSATRCPQCDRTQAPPADPDALLEGSGTGAPQASLPAAPVAQPRPAPVSEPSLDDEDDWDWAGARPGAAASRAEAGDIGDEIIIPALSGSDDSLSGIRVVPPADLPAAAPRPKPQPQPHRAPEVSRVSPPPRAAAATYVPPPRTAAPPPQATPRRPPPHAIPEPATTAGGGFLSPRDLAAAFKLNFDPHANYAGGLPPSVSGEADELLNYRRPAGVRPRRKRRWGWRLFLLLLIAGGGFAALMWVDPVFRIRTQRWAWDKWVWFRESVLTPTDVDLESGQPRSRPGAAKKAEGVPTGGPGGSSGSAQPAGTGAAAEAGTAAAQTAGGSGAAAGEGQDDSGRTVTPLPPDRVTPRNEPDPFDTPPAATTVPAAALNTPPPDVRLEESGSRPSPTGPANPQPSPPPPGDAFTPEMFSSKPDEVPARPAPRTRAAPAPATRPQGGSRPSAAPPPAPAATKPSGVDLKQQELEMWRLRNEAIDAEAHDDFATAVRNYERIKGLPKSVWPSDLDVRLRRARGQVEAGKGGQ